MQVYTKKDVEKFCSSGNVTLAGEYCHAQSRNVLETLARHIRAMPVSAQALILEGGHDHVIGDKDALGDELGTAAGIYHPHTATAIWSMHGRGQFGTVTMTHELGHRTDHLICDNGDIEDYFSSSNKDWIKATAKTLTGSFKAIGKEAGYLYQDYRFLGEHVYNYAYSDASNAFPRESFAEIFNHWVHLFGQYKGDERQIDDVMMQAYPYLWEVFKAEAIPRIENLAGQFQDASSGYQYTPRRLCNEADIQRVLKDNKQFHSDDTRFAALIKLNIERREQFNANKYGLKIAAERGDNAPQPV